MRKYFIELLIKLLKEIKNVGRHESIFPFLFGKRESDGGTVCVCLCVCVCVCGGGGGGNPHHPHVTVVHSRGPGGRDRAAVTTILIINTCTCTNLRSGGGGGGTITAWHARPRSCRELPAGGSCSMKLQTHVFVAPWL